MPSLYFSDILERHRGIYYDALTRVRVSSDLVHWAMSFSYHQPPWLNRPSERSKDV